MLFLKVFFFIFSYNEMLRNGTHIEFGIIRPCVLNNLPNFHVLVNFTVDVMHDLMLGVLKYDIKRILIYYNRGNLLDLEILNRRIKQWNFGCKETIRICAISKSHLKESGTISMNAKEVWFFVENLPFLLDDLVPTDDEYFRFILLMHDLLDCCLQPQFGIEELHLLDQIISEHHKFYKEQLQGTLTPKFHFLIHYKEVIMRCGPLKDLMCFRLEAKHQEVKSYTNVSHNRKNVPVSIATKQMYRFSDTILSFDGDCLKNFVSSIKNMALSLFDNIILDSVKCFLTQNNRSFEKFICAEKVTYKGTIFAKDEYLVINEDIAALIVGIIVADNNVVIMYYNAYICFEGNLRSYAVLEIDNKMILYNFIESFKYIPVPSNSRGGLKYVKKLRRY